MFKKTITLLLFCLMILNCPKCVLAEGSTDNYEKDNENPLYMDFNDEDFNNPEFVQKWCDMMISYADKQPAVGDWKNNDLNKDNVNEKSSTQGSWSWRDGVICIRDSYAFLANYDNGHAGIVGIAPNYYCVIEANPGSGVENVYGAWHENNPSAHVYQVGVTNTTVEEDAEAAEWADDQVGKNYGYPIITLLSDRTKYYCSHLVYAAYLDVCNVDLNTSSYPGLIHPYEILNNAQVTRIFTYIPD